MNIQNNLNSANFTAQMPKKQTYKAMKKYYQSIGDADNAKLYKSLEYNAKSRLHDKKFADAQQRVLDLSETVGVKAESKLDKFKYILAQAKNLYIVGKEAVLSVFYGAKKLAAKI